MQYENHRTIIILTTDVNMEYTVEPLLLAEPTFSDQNTNLYLAAFNISDVYIENTIITMLVLTSASNST